MLDAMLNTLGDVLTPVVIGYIALGVFIDIASYASSEYGRRERYAVV